jgi:plastocyanin
MIHTVPRHAALLALATALVAPRITAQLSDAPVLPLGRTLDGTLSRPDPTLNEKGRFKVFRLDARAGQRYAIVMRADDFDAFVSIGRQVGGLTDYIASDDDGAGNSNARLKWTARDGGTYYVIAQSLKADGVGNFTVRLDTMPPVVRTPPRMVALGEAMTGSLTDTDPEVDDKGPYYKLYRVPLRRGQRISIEMSSTELDSYVGIGRMVGDSLNIDSTDDDGAGEKNARLRFTAQADGDYIIRAQSLEPNATGAYTLKVTERVTRPATVLPLAVNTPVSGELTDSDEEADDGTFFDAYRVTVRAGETWTFTMRSTAVDSYVVLGAMTDGEWNQIAYDDDGGGGKTARLEHTFDRAGEYIIRANSVGSPSTGAYTIRATKSAGAPAARRRA